jgi:predicted RNA-binding protein with PIN domain
MRTRWLIVDGYSLLHRMEARSPASRGFSHAARGRIARRLEELIGTLADRITVVFDGTGEDAGSDAASAVVEVVFSPGDKTADTVIERLVSSAPDPGGILVVTSDRAERQTVGAAGAHSMSCGNFLTVCDHQEQMLARAARAVGKKASRPTLGDFFPG